MDEKKMPRMVYFEQEDILHLALSDGSDALIAVIGRKGKAAGGLTSAAADPPPLALRRAAELFR